MICDKCGESLRLGDWPFCPHGVGVANVITDDIPGGQTIETLDHEELTFYSKQAIRDAADIRGLRIKDKWAGPHDKHLTNWAAGIDAKTLENATVLVSRGCRSPLADDRGRLETYRGSSRTVKKWSEVT